MNTNIKKKKKNDETARKFPSWHNSVAGAVGAGGARVLTAPLDLIKIRLQLDLSSLPRNMMKSMWDICQRERGGLLALFRGNAAAMHLWVWYGAVNFSVYEPTKVYMGAHVSSNPTAVAFTAGAMAGAAATLATYPFDLCRTALASVGMAASRGRTTRSPPPPPPPQTMLEFARAVHRSAGWSGFFAGCGPALWQVIPYLGISFATYEGVIRLYAAKRRGKTDEKGSPHRQVSVSGMAGMIAGGVSKLSVYPLDTAKKRLQAQSFAWISSILWTSTPATGVPAMAAAAASLKYQGTWHCLVTIVQEEGVGGLYRGLVPAVLKTMTATGLTFAFYTFTKNTLQAMHPFEHEEEGPRRRL